MQDKIRWSVKALLGRIFEQRSEESEERVKRTCWERASQAKEVKYMVYSEAARRLVPEPNE